MPLGPKSNGRGASTALCTLPSLFVTLTFLCLVSFFIFFTTPKPIHTLYNKSIVSSETNSINVFVADLPRSLSYGLIEQYWASDTDHRLPTDPDVGTRSTTGFGKYPPFPENLLVKQYSAEYWIMGDLETPEEMRTGSSFARRVGDWRVADVVFVPFFAALSAEMELGSGRGAFRKKSVENQDYLRQREVVDFVKNTEAWKNSGGRDHVFVLTDPVAMWHVRAEIAPAILLVVDFGGWYKLDSKSYGGNSSDRIEHTQVSLLKDVIVPYTYMLPRLSLSEYQKRNTLLYFKGAKHRHRGGLVRESLWDLLVNEPGVVMEEGFPNATGRQQSIRGMRSSEFCLHPAGDTPTSCRLFDAIQSLCIPVIVSDNIELPFEGSAIDYSEFSVFVAVGDALKPKWLVDHLKHFSKKQKEELRQNMARVQPFFQYDNGYPAGIGPIPRNGAVNHIWKKVHQKLPAIKESIVREKRKPLGTSIPRRCHCT
ncbi:probable arabinosyltransferase ARAD1 [Rutidosis leptorrhynchoides]|uniref:probable arabinosyltransferase ARAD1 n=1 Tax=Rutidosis leptorrhynchoides TaxID=125765 RepID=UPI003A98DEE5